MQWRFVGCPLSRGGWQMTHFFAVSHCVVKPESFATGTGGLANDSAALPRFQPMTVLLFSNRLHFEQAATIVGTTIALIAAAPVPLSSLTVRRGWNRRGSPPPGEQGSARPGSRVGSIPVGPRRGPGPCRFLGKEAAGRSRNRPWNGRLRAFFGSSRWPCGPCSRGRFWCRSYNLKP